MRAFLLLTAVAALLAACGGSASAPQRLDATITVKGGKPEGGVQDLRVKKNGQIHLVVKSDTADEVHVHGYDVKKDVAKGGAVSFDIPAKIDGAFEIEIENAKQQLAKLTVEP